MTSEHFIRLRGGWERQAEGEGNIPTPRITLPTTWPPDWIASIRLRRSFGRPPIDVDRQELVLRLEDVAGLRRVWLNDRALPLPEIPGDSIVLPIGDPLPDRNVLILEIDPSSWAIGERGPGVWGSIALVIRDRGAEGGGWPGATDAL